MQTVVEPSHETKQSGTSEMVFLLRTSGRKQRAAPTVASGLGETSPTRRGSREKALLLNDL